MELTIEKRECMKEKTKITLKQIAMKFVVKYFSVTWSLSSIIGAIFYHYYNGKRYDNVKDTVLSVIQENSKKNLEETEYLKQKINELIARDKAKVVQYNTVCYEVNKLMNNENFMKCIIYNNKVGGM